MKVAGRHFLDRAGQPFFWLGDTAWNIVLKGEEDEWAGYLETRASQGFNGVQFVTTQWRGCTRPRHGPTFVVDDGSLVIREEALDRVDRFIRLANQHGLVAAPVMFWAFSEEDPGQALSVEHLVELGKRMVEHWGGHEVIWILGGDGWYLEPVQVERWSRIGRGIFGDRPEAVVTLHPVGQRFPGEAYREEPWYSFVGVQSGHGQREGNFRWQLQGPFAKRWTEIEKPFVDLEPNYEEMIGIVPGGKNTGGFEVRRRAWWSVLATPPCGIVYGHNSIWIWGQGDGEQAENHGPDCTAWPWRTRLRTDGAHAMTVLRLVVESLPWTELRPVPEALLIQPGQGMLAATVLVTATADRTAWLAYTPEGEPLELLPEATPLQGWEWIDPCSAEVLPARAEVRRKWLNKESVRFTPPERRDWVLRRRG